MRSPWSLLFSREQPQLSQPFLIREVLQPCDQLHLKSSSVFPSWQNTVFLPKPGFLYNLYGLIAVVWERGHKAACCAFFVWLQFYGTEVCRMPFGTISDRLCNINSMSEELGKKIYISKTIRNTAELFYPCLLWPLAPPPSTCAKYVCMRAAAEIMSGWH